MHATPSSSVSCLVRVARAVVLGVFVWSIGGFVLLLVPDRAASVTATAEITGGTGGVTLWNGTPTGAVKPGAQIPDAKKPKKPAKPRPAKRRKRRRAKPPVISGFAIDARTLFDDGAPLTVRFRVKSRARQVRVRLIVRTRGGRYVRTIALGVRATKDLQTITLTRTELGIARRGVYKLRLTAQDGKGRRAARAADVRAWLAFNYATHRFPVIGNFFWGGEGSRFGAGRPGHKHQGQDLSAAEGTPIVAPHGGKISWVRYQDQGAGWYVVLDSDDEDRDYVFMHLQAGSIEVKQGDQVPTGKLLGRVGSTGISSGPHLHFEIWTDGNWWAGGRPVDPVSILKSWYKLAPGRARAQDPTPA